MFTSDSDHSIDMLADDDDGDNDDVTVSTNSKR